MKKLRTVIICLVLASMLYLGRPFIFWGYFLVYDALAATKPVITEGKKDWQYTLTDGTIVGVGMSYRTHPGFIDNYIWYKQKVYVYLQNGTSKRTVKTIDLSKFAPDKANCYYHVLKIEPDDRGCRILYYWCGERCYYPQVLRNVPLDAKVKWAGHVDKLSVQDYTMDEENFKKNYMNTKL